MIESIYRQVGRRIRLERLRLSLTQEHVARKVGLSRVSVTNIESGRQRVSLEQVNRFARTFRIKPARLLNGR